MKYKELKEFKFEDWDGKPFKAVVSDGAIDEITVDDKQRLKGNLEPITITGWNNNFWLQLYNTTWKHVYRIEDNKDAFSRMTNRELSKWLAEGNGERYVIGDTVSNNWKYVPEVGNKPVDHYLKVRTWDSDEWVEPTIDLIKEK